MRTQEQVSIIGRGPNDRYLDARSTCRTGPAATVEYVSGAIGSATVQVFISEDDEDRGGVVLRLSIADWGSSFLPHAKLTPHGVELHLAGDAEAWALTQALQSVLSLLELRAFPNDPDGDATYSSDEEWDGN